jgi:hypothetical protein
VAVILELKPRPFPNRHSFLQFIHNPLACQEALVAMRSRHSQKKGRSSNWDKTNPVTKDYELKPKSLCGLFGNSFQLVLGHVTMRLVIDSLNFAAILDWSDYSPEINNRARVGYVTTLRRKRSACHRNFRNDICHALRLIATVIPSALSATKEIQK